MTKSPGLNDAQRKPVSTAIQLAPQEHVIKLVAFPDEGNGQQYTPATIPNLDAILKAHGIVVQYNLIKKRAYVTIPGHQGTIDNAAEVTLAKVISLAASYNMPIGTVPMFLDAIADENAFNPAADWIRSKPWDGENRLPALYDTIQVRDGYPTWLRDLLLRKWMLSAAAAALMPSGFKSRGVLTLQGKQGIGKTSWLKSLIDEPELRDDIVKVDHHLDPSNKDSVMTATSHLLVEIGEVDSSFKKDIARLKGFLTSDFDKIRKPYGRRETDQPRRTVFMASVNETNFLVDTTGNSRWWTIRAESIDFKHSIDMQQLFAQLAEMLDQGEVWWLNRDEEEALEHENGAHLMVSVVEESVLAAIDEDVSEEDRLKRPAVGAMQLLVDVGIERPTNAQARECGTILRRLYGDPKRIKGGDKWRVPLLSYQEPVRPTIAAGRTKPRFD
jgi:predicted P-loop ATPase